MITDEPVVAEADDKANDDPAEAQEIALPAVVTGSVGKTEDVDWYRFRGRGRADGSSSASGATGWRTRSTTCRRTWTR